MSFNYYTNLPISDIATSYLYGKPTIKYLTCFYLSIKVIIFLLTKRITSHYNHFYG